MDILRNIFMIRPADERRSSVRNLDLNDSAQLSQAVLGSLLILTGSIFRRSLIGFGITMSGACLLSRSISRGRGHRATVRGSRASSVNPAAPFTPSRDSSLPHRTAGGGVRDQEGCKVVRSIKCNLDADQIFRFLRNLENAPRFLPAIESVHVLDSQRSHWIAKAVGGTTTEWYMEIINEHPNEMIAWQSLEGSDLNHAGSVRLESCSDGSTEIKVSMEFHATEAASLPAYREDAEKQLMEALARLTAVLNTAESQPGDLEIEALG
jgi:uncharacterized membrane protein